MDRSLIERYAAGATVPAEGIRGLGDAELNAFPVPGTWSIRQIVLHLMDSDLIGADRMKRVIAMDSPALIAYDESAFARALGYDRADVQAACEVFRLNRLLTAAILRDLPDAAFARTGEHNEAGRLTLEDLLRTYVEHLDHHMRFLREKRKMLGKPMDA